MATLLAPQALAVMRFTKPIGPTITTEKYVKQIYHSWKYLPMSILRTDLVTDMNKCWYSKSICGCLAQSE